MTDIQGPTAATRDLRLDFFRGLALFCIFIDHVPNNFFGWFTVQSLALSDAAEMFILISGYTAGLVFGRAFETRGPIVASLKIYHRVWQLYIAHVFLFMLYMGLVAHTMGALNSSIYAEELGIADFLREPDVAIVMAMTLRFQPTFLDILPLYIVLLGALPAMLALFRLSPFVGLILSFVLWCAVQIDAGIALTAYPRPSTWYFNPFAWQFLFFVGAYFGWKGEPEGIRRRPNRWLSKAAIAVALAALAIRLSWTAHWYYDPFPAILPGELAAMMNKTDLSAPRLLNVLALAVVVAHFIGPRERWLTHPIAKPFILCGRHSLHIFCIGILLAVLGHLVLNEFFGGYVMQAAVTLGGIGIMIGVAALMDWFRTSESATSTGGKGQRAAAALLTVAVLCGMGSTGARAAETPCPIPGDAFEFEPYLPKTLAALEAGKEVTIVTIGGAATEGQAASGNDASWPARMGVALKDHLPQSQIVILNRSIARQTAVEMVNRFDRDVVAARPTLVIWETGTIDAVRGVDPTEFRETLRAGLEKLRATQSEVIFMDMQYSRLTHAVIHFNRYLILMRGVADISDVPLFPRHKIMRDWAEAGILETSEGTPEARRALADKLYRCIGSAVATFVLRRSEPQAESQ